ncbi:hypothetical protein BT93_L1174 [Corymbia citriodora subsp. variegata]|uniref:DUF396-domain-containing protein n=1 Tax=Corymbia citriodora subsp. variegata TaxID=360336 RepID=A0A8T0CEB4_CORYI|nr:hypothetical protein BT93_L1174 [Corymbia citriodora subsp. variegata]
MYILPLLGYLGLALGFSFLTLSIASGLYYLSELVEEYSVFSAKLLHRLIYAIIAIQLLLSLVDKFPWHLTLLGIISHAIYSANLRHFPVVKLSDPIFLLSCVLVLLNHWLWFRFFSDPNTSRGRRRRDGDMYGRYGYAYDTPSFTEIASYFGICVWLVPFALFVSLSAGENVLPSMGSEYATGPHVKSHKKGHRRRNTGLAKSAVEGARQWVGETGAVMGLWRSENVRPI